MVRLPRQLNVEYVAIRDPSYPRNARIRAFLESELGAHVHTIPASTKSGRLRRLFDLFRRARRISPRPDIVILSEFSLAAFPVTWLIARLSRATHVVDFFVGLYETEVGDFSATSPRSIRAHALRLVDRLAILSADICLTDTPVRAERFRREARGAREFVALPVGAPTWAREPPYSVDQRSHLRELRFLYNGSYLPLHGLSTVVEAFSSLARGGYTVQMVGDGPLRQEIERQVREAGLSEVFFFSDYLYPISAIRETILASDVVLGVFGDSEKASGIVANKVWQALYLDRVVITRTSPALHDIAALVGHQLIEVSPDIDALKLAIADLISAGPGILRVGTGTAERLERYVQAEFVAAFLRAPLSEYLSSGRFGLEA